MDLKKGRNWVINRTNIKNIGYSFLKHLGGNVLYKRVAHISESPTTKIHEIRNEIS